MPRVRLQPATDREALVPLLLEADESEAVLRTYLNRGALYRCSPMAKTRGPCC